MDPALVAQLQLNTPVMAVETQAFESVMLND